VTLAGNGGKPIDIEPYDPSGEALAYVLKLADRSDCHWDCSNNYPCSSLRVSIYPLLRLDDATDDI
jgi:hypothetical protein